MRKVFLLTGFNNWGKTTLIKELFGKHRFAAHIPHKYSGKEFCVIPQSNDDLGEDGYINAYCQRVTALTNRNRKPTHIFSAFCPTKELTNDSSRIISNIYQNDQVYLLPIEYKWCGHAKLMIHEITTYLSSHKNMKIYPISNKVAGQPKLKELQQVLAPLL